MESDEQLVNEILTGNQHRFRELVTRYQSRVLTVAMKVANNQRDAEDISQEVFLQLYRSLSDFKGKSSFYTWVYRLTMNKAIDYKRKQEKVKVQELEETISLYSEENILPPEEALIKSLDKEFIHSVLLELTPVYRDILISYYFEGLSYKEIALKFQIEVKTVESRLYRAKRLLKDKHKGGSI